jgi:hypothetical protein
VLESSGTYSHIYFQIMELPANTQLYDETSFTSPYNLAVFPWAKVGEFEIRMWLFTEDSINEAFPTRMYIIDSLAP